MDKYSLELVEQYPKLNLYSIRFDGEQYTEIENFVLKFSENQAYKKDLDIILSWLDNIVKKGALERYSRPESAYGSGVKAIPVESNNLRLYCIRLSDNTLIIGNGGIKDADKWQNSPILFPMVKLLEDTERFIKSRLKTGSLQFAVNGELIGDINFTRHNDEEEQHT